MSANRQTIQDIQAKILLEESNSKMKINYYANANTNNINNTKNTNNKNNTKNTNNKNNTLNQKEKLQNYFSLERILKNLKKITDNIN